MLSDARYIREGGAGGGGGGKGGGNTKAEVEAVSGSIDEQTKLLQELQKAWRAAADDDSRQKIKAQIEQAQAVLDVMNGKVIAPDGSLKALNEELAELNKQRELLTDPIDIEIIDNQIREIKDAFLPQPDLP
jgi:ABC-type transporter Mla subunit MlaD